MSKILLVQIDGHKSRRGLDMRENPNLALMKLSHWKKAHGHEVHFTKSVDFVPGYDSVYASAIFKFSAPHQATFRKNYPDAVIGGTGFGLNTTVEELTGTYEHYDYSLYPTYKPSIGFSQRGCRLNCGFCVVPAKEGRPKFANTINEIWRGEGHPKDIVLLDNDFFGQADWKARIAEIRDGGFRVSFNQGLNVRLINEEACAALATIPYYDDQFTTRRLYTAWDNLKDEGIFFRGVDMLEAAGVKARRLMVYMLMGYDADETAEWNAQDHNRKAQKETRLYYRYRRMKERGINVYPMVYDRANKSLCHFTRFVVNERFWRGMDWTEYKFGVGAPA